MLIDKSTLKKAVELQEQYGAVSQALLMNKLRVDGQTATKLIQYISKTTLGIDLNAKNKLN
jgi:hypothetical protein